MVVICFLTGLTACEKDDPTQETVQVVKYPPVAVQKSNPVQLYAHYMPWYEDPGNYNGHWGMHWTMNTRNPEIIDSEGKRQIASHFYPLSGPYASSDRDLIEYHLLLMKYSGIDGVLIDWYGSTDWNDYGNNRKNSEALIAALDAVGLKFAIVYEDRTIPEVLKKEPTLQAVDAAQFDMQYLEEHYFGNKQYIRINGKPLLLVFGPETFHQPEEWGEILGVLSEQPVFLPLNYASKQTIPHSTGEYIWVDQGSLAEKYKRAANFDVFMGGAYPGFLDFYKEGGWGEGYFTIDHRNGETFRETLLLAKSSGVDYLQLITWNDYGEGTMIEPTREFGFTLLEQVQDFAGVIYEKDELESINQLYALRKNAAADKSTKQLDQAFYYFASLQANKAIHLIDSIQSSIQP